MHTREAIVGKMKKKILLVEDNPDLRELVERQLGILGYDSILARDGQEAIRLAESERPDVIIMDLFLPKFDGLEAAARIRKNPNLQLVPIIAATGRAEPGDRELCLNAGCDEYLAKPYAPQQLGDAIRRLLKKARRSPRSGTGRSSASH
jgi:two-component system phosphate regulon response regulator PhoB/two-component system alkaline phosphatase synthesis response regulator PhoP